MQKAWKPKQRSDAPMICRWCGCEFTAEYQAKYCAPRCRYAYKNEITYRRAQFEGMTIRELHSYDKILKACSLM